MTMVSGLFTDLYELRMAASYRRRGMAAPATFSLFARALPPERGFLVAAGLGNALRALNRMRLTDDDLAYLSAQGMPTAMTDALRGIHFTGEVWAVPEGRLVFAGEPLLEVTAPIAEAQLAETLLLNSVTAATAVASKAARCRLAAGPASLIDFSMRRCHGTDAAMIAARSSAIAGFDATSNVAAARTYGLRAAGTMAHSYVEAFPDEAAAFTAFARDFPDDAVFLVDTYDTLTGVERAIQVARQLRMGDRFGVRLDSGDLAELAIRTRRRLDQEDLEAVRIVASGGLDEKTVADLVARHIPVDAYGVGTHMGVATDAPSLDTAYKLVEYDNRLVMKLSSGKVTLPGAKQIHRGDNPGADLLALRGEAPPPGTTPLLVPVMRDGRRLRTDADRHGPADSVAAARARCAEDLDRLPPAARRIHRPQPPIPRVSAVLTRLTTQVHADVRSMAVGVDSGGMADSRL